MFKWFKEKILGIKPIFKVKFEQSWFSEKWYCVKFSNNNGWTWRYIIGSRHDIDSSCGEEIVKVDYFSLDRIESVAKKFSTYEACCQYNDEIIAEVEKNNKIKREKYKQKLGKTKKFVNEFNKKNRT